MAMVRDAVLGVIEKHQLDALVYPTRPKRPELIDPEFRTKTRPPSSGSLTNVANVSGFPDVIVPAGVTSDKLPVTISFVGPAYSEPRLLAYAQTFPHRVSPSTTPPLSGEKFEY
jgi:amidase